MTEPTVLWQPQLKQELFITCPADDVGFGGARGGGKTDGVIGDWLDHEDRYGEDAIGLIFRRERTQLVEFIERARRVFSPLGHKWHEQDKYFRGPKGGRLRCAYLERDADADAYQGHSYSRLYPEEMGTFPSETPINKMQGTLRSGNGVPCQMKGTCNPGGPGHQWVKERYRLGTHRRGFELFTFEYMNPFTKQKVSRTRMFIPSFLTDNRFLGDDYVASLSQVGSEALVRAWLEGDWDAIEGAFFDCWAPAKHIVAPFPIPEDWLRFRSMDWGSASPFSVGWWAVAGEDVMTVAGQMIPRGCLVRYREWYGRGEKLPAEEVADGIKLREDGEEMAYGVLDPSAFAQAGGPSIAERMASRGVHFRPADNKRVARLGALGGWDQMRARLKGDTAGNPMAVCFDNCVDSIRTIPVLQHDPDRMEDLDTEAEDHCFVAGTAVETDAGPIPIERLVGRSGKVHSWGGLREFKSARLTRRNAPVVRLVFEDGRAVTCTPDHLFLTTKGWLPSVDLADEWSYDLGCSQLSSHRQSRNSKGSGSTYAASIFRSAAAAFIGWFGNTIAVLSLKASTFTTLMATAATIGSKTSPAFPPKITLAVSMGKRARLAVWLPSPKPAKPLDDGMDRKMGVGGIPSTSKNTSARRWSGAFLQSVRNVGAIIWSALRRSNRGSFAATPARLVRCASVERLTERQDVYCLTVPDTESFAIEGGLIVHNCADDWRYACMSRPYVRHIEPVREAKILAVGPDNEVSLDDMWAAEEREREAAF